LLGRSALTTIKGENPNNRGKGMERASYTRSPIKSSLLNDSKAQEKGRECRRRSGEMIAVGLCKTFLFKSQVV